MDGKVVIKTELDTKSFDAQIEQTRQKLNRLENAYEKASKASGKFKPNEQAMANLRVQIEKTRNSLVGLEKKQADLDKIGLTNTLSSLGDIGQNLDDVTHKVTKWGLALFGIRSAYMFIRQTMSTLSSENEQIANDIEYMRWILAQTLKPVIEWIIKGLYLILTLINMVSVALFRYNFLAGKGADQFKKMKKSTGGIASDLKEARKQLASFDEMNILADNVKASGGGGGVPGGIDEWDTPDFGEMEQKILKFKTDWFNFGDEMEKMLYNMPFSVWTDAFGQWDLAMYGLTETIHGIWGLITTFFSFVGHASQVLHGIITGNVGETKTGFMGLLGDLWNWIKYTVEVIRGVGDLIKGIIKGIIQTVWGWLFDFINNAIKEFDKFKDKVVGKWTEIRDKIKNKITEIQNFLTEKFGIVGTVIGNVIGGGIKGIVNAILSWAESKINGFLGSINSAIALVNKIPGVNIKPINFVHFPRLAKGGIINMPGRGVPVGSAIGGERGQEGVIPLTDSQQMALLGEAIGRYITINANITNMMNGRIISRELERIQNDKDFAFNK